MDGCTSELLIGSGAYRNLSQAMSAPCLGTRPARNGGKEKGKERRVPSPGMGHGMRIPGEERYSLFQEVLAVPTFEAQPGQSSVHLSVRSD